MKFLPKLLYWSLAIGAAIFCFLSEVKEIKMISGVIAGLMFGIGWIQDIQNAVNKKTEQNERND
jgi:hypothetical protein